MLPRIVLKPKEEGRLQGGHLWAFSNEVQEAPPHLEPGALADLYLAKQTFLGRGFYHPHSLIAFRVLSTQPDEINDDFFEKRLTEAMVWRGQAYPGSKAYRWVFGESDHLPGLIVDRYESYLAVQALSAGMDRLKSVIVSALVKVAEPRGIVWRSDSALREYEGLKAGLPEIVYGDIPTRVRISTENGEFVVDMRLGQKTGFYFDQRDNRQAFAAFCRGKKVLDAFSYSGGFGIAAGRAGARDIVFVDSSEPALELAEENAKVNGLRQITCVHGSVLDLLATTPPGGRFEAISIDPPAYARSKKNLPVALKAYEKLNALAIKAIARGGILASSSCSHHVTRDLFLGVLQRAARKAGRMTRLIELRSQAKDHPVLLAMPETEYLKCAILQVS